MITAGDLKVYSRFSICSIADMEIEIKEGSHGKMILRGYLSKEEKKNSLPADIIKVTGKDGSGQEELLFCGIIQETYIFHENGINQIILKAFSKSVEMDRQNSSQSYQDTTLTCGKIINNIVSKYNEEMICELPTVKIGKPMLQYEETDWEFCKRLAGRMGWGIYGIPTSAGPVLTVGLKEGRKADFSTNRYHCCVDGEYYKQKGGGTSKADFLYYQVESENNYTIGDYSRYQGQKRYIFEKRVELQGDTLVFCYKLGGKYRFMKEERLNKKIAGISLIGKVERTEQEKVYIKLDIDGDGGKAIQPYSWEPVTGNMMYCMPQPGTKACLYFPDCHEENAVAMSNIRTENVDLGFTDVQKRVFATGQGKYMQLFDEGIYFRSEKGETRQQFSLEKEKFIFSAGMKKLVITGKEGITLNAPNIKISTPQEINQYKSEGVAARRLGEIYPKGSRNPATGGEAGFSMQHEFNGLAEQGILAGTVYERYWPFKDEPAYEKDCATWLKVLAGVATALLVGVVVGALVFATGGLAAVALGVTAVQLGVCAGAVAAGVGVAAVASTWYHDKKNGTVSTLGDYVWNAFATSAEVGAAFVGICLSLYAADLLTLIVTGGLPLIPVGGSVITLGEIRLFAWLAASGISSRNLFYQLNDVGMFIFDEKPLRAPTGDERYDAEKGITEALTLQLGYLGMSNPYLYENAMSNIKGLFVMPTPSTELAIQNTTAIVPMDSGTALATSGEMAFTSQQMYNRTILEGKNVLLLTQRDFNQFSNTPLSPEGSNLHPNVPIWKQGDPAYGILKIGNQEIPLRSGAAGPGQYLKILPRGKGSGINAQIPTHVEGHVAGIMRQTGVKEAELFINKPPCATGAMCRYNLNKILPPDSMLTVHFLDENGNIITWLFKSGEAKWTVMGE